MAEKKKACKECGHITTERTCSYCKSQQLVEKYKGSIYVLNVKESDIAKKLNIKHNGIYALKY